MITIRRAEDRGHFDHGWLDTCHTFSFADYHDPAHMGFRSLRVINEDRVQAGHGFPMHGHRDMEILTYVLEGALEHRDSMGNGGIIHPGEVQRMTAGAGIRHSEGNPSADEPVHLLQIWILPEARGLPPSYEQRSFHAQERSGRLRLIASRDGRDGSVTIHQDASIYATTLSPGARVSVSVAMTRHLWVQGARGRLRVDGRELGAGDGVAASGVGELEIEGLETAEALVFDLA